MSRKNGSYQKIGLTGGIGSGKTTAAKRFAALTTVEKRHAGHYQAALDAVNAR